VVLWRSWTRIGDPVSAPCAGTFLDGRGRGRGHDGIDEGFLLVVDGFRIFLQVVINNDRVCHVEN
jgi:hypothetical protein